MVLWMLIDWFSEPPTMFTSEPVIAALVSPRMDSSRRLPGQTTRAVDQDLRLSVEVGGGEGVERRVVVGADLVPGDGDAPQRLDHLVQLVVGTRCRDPG